MAAGSDTFISEMMTEAGFENCILEARYPMISLEQLQEFDVPYILLSSEPYPFKEVDQYALQALIPHSRIILVDGEYFSWYGSRMLDAFDYFRTLDE